MKALLFALAFIASSAIAQDATTGLPSPHYFGTGSPTKVCSSTNLSNTLYIQTDATNGRVWLCDNTTGSWAWEHLVSPLATVLTPLVTPGTLLAGGCTTVSTISMAQAVLGTNAAVAAPVYTSAPTGNPGFLNVTAWVSSNGVVSYQACTIGLLSSSPTFYVRILLF